jgi:hypothetical protein
MATQPNPNTTPSSQANTPENTNSTHQKKKRAPNWLPREEQLAISWLRVSERPEFATNQTGEMFYQQVAENFNAHSTLHHRDSAQIKTR